MKNINNLILCPQCKGRRTILDLELAIFTIGFSVMFKNGEDDGRKKCPTCKGVGKI
jgi:DnaJ-class molecular chaperone